MPIPPPPCPHPLVPHPYVSWAGMVTPPPPSVPVPDSSSREAPLKDVPLCQSWGGTHPGFTSSFFSCWASEGRGTRKQSYGFEAGLKAYMKGFALNFFFFSFLLLFKAFLCTSQLNQNCILLPPVPGRSFLSVICQLDSILVVLSARSDSLILPQKQTHPIAGAQGHFSHCFLSQARMRAHIYVYTHIFLFPLLASTFNWVCCQSLTT